MRRAFKYRLFTNANQERELGIMLETHRRLYNACLEQRQAAYQTEQRAVKYTEQSAWFTQERTTNSFYARLNRSSAQAVMRRLDRAFQNFSRRMQDGQLPGCPRFKSSDRFRSIEFPTYRKGIALKGSKLYVQYVGTIRVKLHRPIEGIIKTATLKREVGKWFVVFSCDLPDVPLVDNGKPPVGIDLGLESFLTTSDGHHEPNPRYFKNALPQLRRDSRAVARKKRGGKNRQKAVRRLQKIHARIRNLRREYHYQVACRLVLAYGLIAAESLNIQGMLRSGRFSQAISDAGWAGFLNILRHKAERAGVPFVEVDPRGTSQQCSGCGQEVRKDLSVRWHECPGCGLSLHRDHNAALNILARGQARAGPAKGNVDHRGQASSEKPPHSCGGVATGICSAVPLDDKVGRLVRMVAAALGMTMSDYVNARLTPIVNRELNEAVRPKISPGP